MLLIKIYQQIGKKKNRLMNNQVTYLFFISNEFIDLSESIWIFPSFLHLTTIPFVKKKNWGYNRATVSSIPWKLFVCNVESCYKNLSKICNFTFNFQNFQKKFQMRKKNWKNSYGFWKIK